jgi:hypothetical protein
MLINLDTHEERSRITPNSDETEDAECWLIKQVERSQITSDSDKVSKPRFVGASRRIGIDIPSQTKIRLQLADFSQPNSLLNQHKPIT